MKVADKTHKAVDMVKEALDKIREYSEYNIFISVCQDEALAKAKEIDEKIEKGEEVGPLAGVPYALKDNFLSKVGNTTAASKILEPFASPLNATAVEKLEAAGAICIGRANLDSFAHGSSTENSYFGPTLNSADKTRVAGGSSGGSAVAVALDIVQFATGTDTGGSIRQPASFNGVYGFKPTYGTISRYGVVAMASSTDCIGFFARSAEDIDLLMEVCAGQDPKDMTTLPDYYGMSEEELFRTVSKEDLGDSAFSGGAERGSASASASHPWRRDGWTLPEEVPIDKSSSCKRIGVITDFDNDSVDPEIRKALDTKINELKAAGHEIVDLSMPTLKYALAVYYILVPAEVASNLSRHDGIRYGFSSRSETSTLQDVYGNSRNDGFMSENKRRIMIGNFVLSSGFYDAYYLKAQKARTLIIQEYEKAFEKCDFILTPVAPNPAFKLGEKTGDPVKMYLEDVMSVPLNLAGLPGLTIPAGKTKGGLPLGLQLVGPRRSDKSLLKLASEIAKIAETKSTGAPAEAENATASKATNTTAKENQ